MRGAADSGKFRQLSRQIAAIRGFCGKFAAGFVFDEVQKVEWWLGGVELLVLGEGSCGEGRGG